MTPKYPKLLKFDFKNFKTSKFGVKFQKIKIFSLKIIFVAQKIPNSEIQAF
jgi:hypothetical protein